MPERIPLTREERKLRRAARREKQRQANIGRARKMHLARVENEKGGSSRPLAVQNQKRELYVGCSGWFYWHWRGAFYPAGLPTSRWFQHYAGRFETVELNAPFYAPGRPWRPSRPGNGRPEDGDLFIPSRLAS
jgi:hypothetical protein